MSPSDVAEGYAKRILAAAHQDQIALAARRLQEGEDLLRGHLVAELRSIGVEWRSLKDPATGKPVSQADKEAIADTTGRKLDLKPPQRMRLVFGSESIEEFLRVLRDIEEILRRV